MRNQNLAIPLSIAPSTHVTSITELLADLRAGRREAFDQMLPLVYHELRRAARRELADPAKRLVVHDGARARALSQVLAIRASRLARPRALPRRRGCRDAPHPRRSRSSANARRSAAVRMRHVTLDDDLITSDGQAESLLELHEALDHLAKLDRAARARRRVPVLRRHDGAGDGGGAAHRRAHGPTRLDQGARTALPGARRHARTAPTSRIQHCRRSGTLQLDDARVVLARAVDEVEPLLDAALELEPDERGAFLDEACGDDASLRAELSALLTACELGDTILAEPAALAVRAAARRA